MGKLVSIKDPWSSRACMDGGKAPFLNKSKNGKSIPFIHSFIHCCV
jgi:hypothetical protein